MNIKKFNLLNLSVGFSQEARIPAGGPTPLKH